MTPFSKCWPCVCCCKNAHLVQFELWDPFWDPGFRHQQTQNPHFFNSQICILKLQKPIHSSFRTKCCCNVSFSCFDVLVNDVVFGQTVADSVGFSLFEWCNVGLGLQLPILVEVLPKVPFQPNVSDVALVDHGDQCFLPNSR